MLNWSILTCPYCWVNVQLVTFPFPVEVTIGFSPEAYTVTEDDGIVTLRVAVLEGELGISVCVNISLISGTAIGKLLCSSSTVMLSKTL